MDSVHESNQPPAPGTNGATDVNSLLNRVKLLEDECARLRQALAKTTEERDRYLKALYENMRNSFAFQNITLAELEKTTAGPVEFAQ